MSVPANAGSRWVGELELEPYLIDLDQGEATVSWRTREAVPSLFSYGTTPDLAIGSIRLEAGRQQSVRLTGLQPDTVYYYDVNGACGGNFRTLPASNRLSFVAVGHTHGSEHFEHYPDSLLIDKLIDLDPQFVVHSGDSTFLSQVGDFDRYFFDLFRDVLPSTPVYLAPGNHDAGWPFYAGLDLRTFKDLFAHPYPPHIENNRREAFYSYVKGDIRFLFLSYTSDLSPGSLQRGWVATELTNSTQEMNALVFGGSNGYGDVPAFLDSLSQFRVDFIIRGDGVQPTNPLADQHGIPNYYVGTGSGRPHRLLHFDYRSGILTVTMYSPAGEEQFVDRIPRSARPPAALAQAPTAQEDSRQGQDLAIRPYLTHLTATGAVLNWRLDSKRSSTFDYGVTHSYEISRSKTPRGKQHSTQLANLHPDTVYHFAIDGVPGQFKTPRDDPELAFVAFGTEEFDTHPDGDLPLAIGRLHPDFLIHVSNGHWNGGVSEYETRFFRTYQGVPLSEAPVYVAPGNHSNLDLFRSLFPYDYAQASGEVHYSLVKAGTRFLFLSFRADLGPTGSQRAWVARELEKSSEAFNVVVLGGTQPVQSDDFLRFLAGAGVDFVIRGDIQQPSVPKQVVDGMPMYFVGTGDPTPHRLLYFERRARVWTVKLISPTGDVSLVDWIYAEQRLPETLRLDPTQAQWSSFTNGFRAIYFPTPSLGSAEVAGVQLRLDLPPDLNSVVVEVYVSPVESSGVTGVYSGQFSGFRSQFFRVDHEDGLVTIPLQQTVPDTGNYFHVKRLMLRFLTSYPLTSDILAEIYLYGPPVFPYGLGIAGSGGTVPSIGTAGEDPHIGSGTFKLEISDALGNSPAIIAGSTGRAEMPMLGGRAYVNLAMRGAFHTWWVMTDGSARVPGIGTAVLPMPIPNDVSLVGLKTYWQGFIVDRGAQVPLGLSHTGGLAVTLIR